MTPMDPDYAARVRTSFGRQQVMALPGAEMTEVGPGLLAPYLTLQETYLPHLTVGRLSSEIAFAEALRHAQSITASFETEVYEMIAYRLECENSGNVECSVRLTGPPRE